MKAEYRKGCLQRDNVEHEEYAGAQSVDMRESRERDGATDLLERILGRNNLNKAYKQVKRNHGAPGIDGMTVRRHCRGCGKTEMSSCKVSGKEDTNQARYFERKSPSQMEEECENSASRR
ncbi:UNVERIFIED_CONTAM: hypothetical protein ABIC26_003710 [Paenibacillus sp. PvR008]